MTAPASPAGQAQALTPLEEQALAAVQADELVELLQALIRCDSSFPPGDCRSAVAELEQRFRKAGIETAAYARSETQPNLVAWLGEKDAHPRLVYHAHIDTVPAGDSSRWSVDPFGGSLVDGRIFGRGAGDDKGSAAAQAIALLVLKRLGVQIPGCLQVALVSDEESGALNGTHWLRQAGLLQPDALVIGEQTANQVCIAERVACGIDLTVFGKSAHGAMPWAGDNAVLKTARVLGWLESRLFPRLRARTHPYLPPATLNVGRIQGGIQWSIVPETCKVEMDRRLLPGETREAAVEEIRAELEAYAAQVEPLRYELYSGGEVAGNVNTPPDDPLVQTAAAVVRGVTGEDRGLGGYVQTSDGRWYARDGIPIIHFGPSDPAVAHSADENISIAQLVEAAKVLVVLALRFYKLSGPAA